MKKKIYKYKKINEYKEDTKDREVSIHLVTISFRKFRKYRTRFNRPLNFQFFRPPRRS